MLPCQYSCLKETSTKGKFALFPYAGHHPGTSEHAAHSSLALLRGTPEWRLTNLRLNCSFCTGQHQGIAEHAAYIAMGGQRLEGPPDD